MQKPCPSNVWNEVSYLKNKASTVARANHQLPNYRVYQIMDSQKNKKPVWFSMVLRWVHIHMAKFNINHIY